jgi:asparagine synthetase B (glutamine-hydrolysing)
MQHVDLFTWLRGAILVKADKVTMANSLELRVPFLDPEIFRAASTIPLTEKITRETTKHALRQALRDIVPGHGLNRPKLGFRCRSGTGCVRICTTGPAASSTTRAPRSSLTSPRCTG